MKKVAAGMLAKISQRLQELILLGELALVTTDPEEDLSEGKYQEWRLASASFLQTVLGASNHYYKYFNEYIEAIPDRWRKWPMEQGLGVLRAVKGEIDFGPLPQVESLVSGEIFDDFIDMAEHLLDNNYSQVVPSLVGAVLEDALRRIAQAHDVPVKTESDNIASLNTKLADASVYSNFVRKKVEVWNAIRNNADHGKFADNSEQDIRGMLEGVRDFLGNHLS
jgi:hypothetical protein